MEQKLGVFLPELHAASWVAVDTEADSLHAYPEKVCLIQISTAGHDELIDPLSRINLDPLLDALSGHELIMHGADYDLRLLEKHHQFTPSAIFDTMLASRLIGERQFGYSTLVEKFLGVKLEKGPQKANWALRPLTERMEKYARNDTHYLKPLADQLRAGLEEKGRLGWHQESCARLIEACTQLDPVDRDSVWRIKGSHLLGRPGLGVLREIWQWRETEAIAANRPPFFVLSHETLVDVAAAAATQRPIDPLLPRNISERRRSGLTKAVADGLGIAAEKLPKILQRTNHRPTDAERKRFMELQKRRDAQAHQLGIDPTLIASRGTLSDLARNWDKYSGELMNWQRELLVK
ncbi:MAG TPA: HRDC domain-containing protein [Candidatus Polarisedimenticolia bacterium]|nr:HRDC domain-containing protein [Candidatus Polarisedimenticolia bacterium]